jgi:hypothetical protein
MQTEQAATKQSTGMQEERFSRQLAVWNKPAQPEVLTPNNII